MLGNRVLNYLHPIAQSGAAGTPAGFYLSLGILTATVLGFGLSLLNGSKSPDTTQQG